jgi:SAM-dependent methyltransferase
MSREAKRVGDLRARWNERAALNPMYFIKADREDWTAGDFLRSGEEDVAGFAVPAFDLLSRPPGQSTALDIGCGLGRLSRALGRYFENVIGVDISQKMIEDGRSFAGGWPANVECRLCDGSGKIPVASASVHFVFSYIVFQHIPTIGIIRTYFSEMSRVMTKDAVARVQVNTQRRPFSKRLQIRVVASDKVPIVHRKLKVHIDSHSTLGAVLSVRQCRRLCEDNGLELLTLTGAHEQYTWLTVRKGG